MHVQSVLFPSCVAMKNLEKGFNVIMVGMSPVEVEDHEAERGATTGLLDSTDKSNPIPSTHLGNILFTVCY